MVTLFFKQMLFNELTQAKLVSYSDMYRWLYMSPSENSGEKLKFLRELSNLKQI